MNNNKEIKAVKTIDPMLIIIGIVCVAALCTWILPGGAFERAVDPASGAELVVPGTYTVAEKNPIGFMDFLMSFTKGMQASGGVIFFLLIVGGMFEVIQSTGAIDAGIANLVKALGNRQLLLVLICIPVFSTISTTAACSEEYLAFLPLMYAACIACGFDSITGVALLWCSSAIGYGASVSNPFTTGIAHGIAGLPVFSGLGLRVALLVAFNVVTVAYVLRYAAKIKKDPTKSSMYEIDKANAESIDLSNVPKLTIRQILVLLVFMGGFVMIAVLVITKGYYMDELSALFIIMGLLAAVIGGIKPNEFAQAFVKGAEGMMYAGLMIGLCRAATTIMSEANVFDTIINAAGNLLDGLNKNVAACGMFIFQDLFNFLVPSGSGQASITMPFMAPLADILGLTRQTATLAYHMGDGLTNCVTPTSGSLMAALAMAKVPWGKWFRFIAPLWAVWVVIACVFMVIAVSIGYGPF